MLAIGVTNLIMTTIFHGHIVRLLRQFYSTKFITDRLHDPQTALIHRQMLKMGIGWTTNWIDSPWVWRMGLVYGVVVTICGLAWLLIRAA